MIMIEDGLVSKPPSYLVSMPIFAREASTLPNYVSDEQKGVNSTTLSVSMPEDGGFCTICWESIALQETALVKGCEHAYCVTCILRWAMYNRNPTCPQCKHPFQCLNVHRSLDGSIHDYMFEESVCLLLRATWFMPLTVEEHEELYDENEVIYQSYDYLDEVYFSSSSSLRIGNRRWGDNGYIRGGHKEARPVNREYLQHPDAGPSSGSPKKKEVVAKYVCGKKEKRELKREAAGKAAAVKHHKHLLRFGRK